MKNEKKSLLEAFDNSFSSISPIPNLAPPLSPSIPLSPDLFDDDDHNEKRKQ